MFRRVRAQDVQATPERTAGISVTWLTDGWPEDVLRGIESFRRFGGQEAQHVVVDTMSGDSDPARWPQDVEVVALEPSTGWAAARNVGLRRSTGSIFLLVDGSVEATGDPFLRFVAALEDETAGVAGPFGLVTDDLREFAESEGPDVDAIEAYLMAFRREILEEVGGFDERFAFYRHADLELSFRIKDRGYRAVVVPDLPLKRHEHRRWAATPEDERDRLSKRNFNRFLERFRGRFDLCVGPS
ncbi:MAG: glycosyltransferase family 2 protein [Actinomycetota bacterium]